MMCVYIYIYIYIISRSTSMISLQTLQSFDTPPVRTAKTAPKTNRRTCQRVRTCI